MNKETLERLMKYLDLTMIEISVIETAPKAFEYLSKAMTIIERSYYASEIDPQQMELDFNEVDYRKMPLEDDDS